MSNTACIRVSRPGCHATRIHVVAADGKIIENKFVRTNLRHTSLTKLGTKPTLVTNEHCYQERTNLGKFVLYYTMWYVMRCPTSRRGQTTLCSFSRKSVHNATVHSFIMTSKSSFHVNRQMYKIQVLEIFERGAYSRGGGRGLFDDFIRYR